MLLFHIQYNVNPEILTCTKLLGTENIASQGSMTENFNVLQLGFHSERLEANTPSVNRGSECCDLGFFILLLSTSS